jgi:nicotinate-nucleotide pyrophosphorylase (carboxylating)
MQAPDAAAIAAQVSAALAEDLGGGDLTAALLPPDSAAQAQLIVREEAVLCGSAWFEAAFRQLDPDVALDWSAQEGERLRAGQTLCELRGRARALLSAERTALNFLQTLSATASAAARYVAAVAGTGAVVLDTRKTLPGLRMAQKYAVRCGGASNHRMGLFDAILIKENHIRAAGSIEAALERALASAGPGTLVEIEVEDLAELERALEAGATRVLLDNFALDDLSAAVRLNAGRARLEASGGVNLDTVRAIALTGVDFVSVGQLTKDVAATDYSLLFRLSGLDVEQ